MCTASSLIAALLSRYDAGQLPRAVENETVVPLSRPPASRPAPERVNPCRSGGAAGALPRVGAVMNSGSSPLLLLLVFPSASVDVATTGP